MLFTKSMSNSLKFETNWTSISCIMVYRNIILNINMAAVEGKSLCSVGCSGCSYNRANEPRPWNRRPIPPPSQGVHDLVLFQQRYYFELIINNIRADITALTDIVSRLRRF